MTIILSVVLLLYSPNQEVKPPPQVKRESAHVDSVCSQSAAERDSLIREAVENQYWVRRVAYYGIENTSDRVLRRRIMLVEGDIFTRENLVRSLERLSRLKRAIHPVRLSDVEIWLDRPERRVDTLICFKERRQRRVSGRRPR